MEFFGDMEAKNFATYLKMAQQYRREITTQRKSKQKGVEAEILRFGERHLTGQKIKMANLQKRLKKVQSNTISAIMAEFPQPEPHYVEDIDKL